MSRTWRIVGFEDRRRSLQPKALGRRFVGDWVVLEPVDANRWHRFIAEFIEPFGELSVLVMITPKTERETSEDEALVKAYDASWEEAKGTDFETFGLFNESMDRRLPFKVIRKFVEDFLVDSRTIDEFRHCVDSFDVGGFCF